MNISMIAAMSKNRVIGKEQAIPWDLPTDYAYFEQTTWGHTIIMGRKNFEAHGSKPLQGRHNVVMTRTKGYQAEGVDVIHSVDEAMYLYQKEKEIFIIGGEHIYRLFLPIAKTIYLTVIDIICEGDTFFPQFNEAEWMISSSRRGKLDKDNRYEHTYYMYKRK
jgi:dihydrofolate reductase